MSVSGFSKLSRGEKRDRVLNVFGLGLLALCFIASAVKVLLHAHRTSDPSIRTIRFSHWQLEGGVRQGFEQLARQYEALCKARGEKVLVEQVPVPERVYANWFLTQLIGGEGPDVMEVSSSGTDEIMARYFDPLTSALTLPNPYNKGTELEKLPWRNTFVDGLDSVYKPELLEYYTVPFTLITVRVFYNETLYKKVAGDTPPPKTFTGLMALCEKIRTELPGVSPIAGSKYNSPIMIGQLFGSQTQRMTLDLNRTLSGRVDQVEASLAYLRGEWSMRSPQIESGLRLVQDVAKYMPDGFMQLAREDATLNFVQERAVMISTGTWDRSSITSQCPFPVGGFKLPFPTKGEDKYGAFALGGLSEASVSTGGGFAVNRASPNRELALDFLKYITSQKANETFSNESGWLPVIVGSKGPKSLDLFRPEVQGYTGGFMIANDFGGGSARLWGNNFYLLTRESGPGKFIEAMEKDLAQRYLEDLGLYLRNRGRTIDRKEPALAALWWMARQDLTSGSAGATSAVGGLQGSSGPTNADRLSELLESQNESEATWYRVQSEIRSHDAPSP